jgi:1-acyl-sn-glycerol-3-phosphate acyltransferase
MQPPSVQAHDATASRLLALVQGLATELHGDVGSGTHITLDTRFEHDLGFDSLARAELFTRVEAAFGAGLSVDLLATLATPRELLRALADSERPYGRPPSDAHADANAGGCAGQAERPPIDVPQRGSAAREPVYSQTAATLVDALNWHADRHPLQVHLVFVEQDGNTASTMAYGDLRTRAGTMAAGFRALGVEAGDTVALMLPTTIDYFVAFTAILLCGAVAVPIYPPARLAQLAEHVERHAAVLANAGVRLLVTFDEAATVGQILKAHVPALAHVATPRHIVGAAARESNFAPLAPQPTDIALLQYTSGSTGTPKGVVLTHANLVANIRAMGERIAVAASDVLVSWLPLYHDMGLIGAWLAPLYFGVPLVVTSPLTFLARPVTWLKMVSRYRGTITGAPNFAYEYCARHLSDADLDGIDLSSLRYAFCGAEPVSAPTLSAFAQRMARAGFDASALAPVYGLAENTLALTLPPPGRGLRTDRIEREALTRHALAHSARNGEDALEIVSCGIVLAGASMRIVDAKGEVLPERCIGRIEFRGDAATSGYYGNAEQTARLFDNGWLDTGDLGYIASGELYVTGRAKDLIIRGGRHFFPYELEAAIARLPGITPGGAAVCGDREAQSGTQRLVVFAETDEHADDQRARLVAQINAATIGCFGAPAERIVLVAPHSIPRTPNGKIRHAALLDQFHAAEQAGDTLHAPHAGWRQLGEVATRSVPALVRRALVRATDLLFGLRAWALVACLAPWVWCRIARSSDTAKNWRIASNACRFFLSHAGLKVDFAGTPLATNGPPALLAANHTSYIDVIVLMACLTRPVHFVAKRELSAKPFVGSLLRALGARFVTRFDYRESIEDEASLVAAARDETLLFFPEGTFVRESGLRAFHLGAFRAACLAQRPVVPIALRGTRAVLRDGDRLPRRAPITVTTLSPLAPQGTDLRAIAMLRAQVRAAILAQCGERDLAPNEAFDRTAGAMPAAANADRHT